MYYVIYEDYTEYNQFEGSWNVCFKSFSAKEEADVFIETIKGGFYYKNIIGPLTEAK